MTTNVRFNELVDTVTERVRQQLDAKPASERERVLDTAKQLVHGDRNKDYDEPADNFRRIADLWSVYLGTPIEPYDVAMLNVLQKIARIMHSPRKLDSWVDIAGYAACGWESLPQASRESSTP